MTRGYTTLLPYMIWAEGQGKQRLISVGLRVWLYGLYGNCVEVKTSSPPRFSAKSGLKMSLRNEWEICALLVATYDVIDARGVYCPLCRVVSNDRGLRLRLSVGDARGITRSGER